MNRSLFVESLPWQCFEHCSTFKLKEKEDFRALYEKVSSENESLSANAQKWNKYEENRRNTLLESAPEEERERLAGLDLDTLEYVTNKINTVHTVFNITTTRSCTRKSYSYST